jgi:putative spermidine/putrescine transport system permease protein
LVAEGLLTYLGPRGWLNRVLLELGVADSPVRLIHNYWGVMLSLVISGFPFTFLLTLSYVTGIDPALEQAGAMLGARARQRFFRILLPLLAPGLAITLALAFVQAFTVFPSAVLLARRPAQRVSSPSSRIRPRSSSTTIPWRQPSRC